MCCVRQLLSLPAGSLTSKTDDLWSKTSSAGRHNLLRYDMLWLGLGDGLLFPKQGLDNLNKMTYTFQTTPVFLESLANHLNYVPHHPLRVEMKFSGGRQPHQIGRRLEAKGLPIVWPSHPYTPWNEQQVCPWK